MRRPHFSRRPTSLALMALALLGSSCARERDGGRAFEAVRTDSAGVEIVLNPTAAGEAPVFAILDSVPELRLGSLDGPAQEQFGSVADVVSLAEGGVAVLDRQAAEIRVFDANGAYRKTLGAKGEGPGELQSPGVLGLLPGDTLAVYDSRSERITRFGPDGTLGRVTTLAADAMGRPFRADFLPDGRLVGQSRWFADASGALPAEEKPTFVRDSAVLTVFAPDGAVQDTVDVLPGGEWIRSAQVSGQMVAVMMRSAAFGRDNVFAAYPDGVWSDTNDRFELRLYDAAGALVRIVRAPGLERPATNAVAQAIHDWELADAKMPDERRTTEEWFALSLRPPIQPAYDRIVVDDRGRLWVREWSGADPATRWWVFSGAGDLLGSVDAPSGTTILAVRCATMWGVARDELDVSYVVRYALRGVEGC